jgi:hypothetical protein
MTGLAEAWAGMLAADPDKALALVSVEFPRRGPPDAEPGTQPAGRLPRAGG